MRTVLLTLLLSAPAFADSVWLINTGANKILVIKEVRTATGLGLKEAKDLVESTPKQVKAGLAKGDAEALVAKLKEVGATAEIRSEVDGKPQPIEGKYSVHLESYGKAKVACVKAVKETLGWGLKESVELVERAPTDVHGLSKETAEKLAKLLNDAGGTAKARLAGE